ncbi:site-2 protease family protein [Euhalothece natronophila Z-M001]|uniref:Zinc metalloprotease n=1 Tax=Euhalothece natronophila Z-M001 TaxID=522448 RepID=A0A5B8NPB7_9CHRO|nr:site-2 protease family protein [Euhalothece natronophila]QDZ40039.1 site-2 protease family protein [Euhalothece natronophila Z-M001]
MNNNIRVGNLFGIPFYINPSWFLVLVLVTWVYGSQLQNFPQLVGVAPWLLGLVAALLLFSSVLAHELGHSFVALKQGIKVNSITLFIFGGIASLEEDSKTPWGALLVAIAGPAVSVLLFVLFTTINFSVSLSEPLSAVIGLLATVNLILALFNMIPGLPLDGGNVLKAIVWKITGNQYRGIFIASIVGQFIGWIAIVLGLFSVFGITQFGSIWTAFIGFFLLQNAGRSAQSATLQDKLSRFTAEEAVSENSPVIKADLNLREFVNEYIIGKGEWSKFLVTDEEGKLIGELKVDDLKIIPTSEWTEKTVRELTTPQEVTSVKPKQSLLEVVMMFEQNKQNEVAVIGDNGVVFGLIEKSGIAKFLDKKQEELKTA